MLTRDWLPHTEERIKAGVKDVSAIKLIYKACIKALKESDLVIVEDTVSNFSTRHQITVALQCRKPTLVLWQGSKYRQFKQMFIHGIDSDILQISEYDRDGVNGLIQGFINKYENIHEKNRFHLVLTGVERQYLDWAQYVNYESRTKVVRDALRKVLESDEDYSSYLQKK